MNKSDTVHAVSKSTGAPKATVDAVLSEFVAFVGSTLGKGEEVAVAGLGTFKTADRAARTGRNPMTGDKIKIAAKRVPKFTASKALKDAVAGGKKKRSK